MIALVALAWPNPDSQAAIPGQPDPNAVKAIETCLADGATAKSDPETCIGRFAVGCTEGAATTSAKEACSNRELLVWTAAMNRDLAELTRLLPAESLREALRDVQHDFVLAKLKTCTFERIAHNDSPTALVAASQCDLRLTARQALWLRQQILAFTKP